MGSAYATEPMAVAQARERTIVANAKAAQRVALWFSESARKFPWRSRRSPYGSLVSEFMLQQTQASRAVEAWRVFMRRFPTISHLARSREAAVVACWRGLGYYRRARFLHAAARAVVAEHGGMIPRTASALRDLPGVGPYTAGAISSIAFGLREPIVDGNVVRVLSRLHARRFNQRLASGRNELWRMAREYIDGARNPARANEGLMELGATVCTPRSPRCGGCPLRSICRAQRLGLQASFPGVPARRRVRRIAMAAIVVHRGGKVALMRRGDSGLWSSMEFPPLVEGRREPSRAVVARELGLSRAALARRGSFDFPTSAGRVNFVVYRAELPPARAGTLARKFGWRWCSYEGLARTIVASAAMRVFEVEARGERAEPTTAGVR